MHSFPRAAWRAPEVAMGYTVPSHETQPVGITLPAKSLIVPGGVSPFSQPLHNELIK